QAIPSGVAGAGERAAWAASLWGGGAGGVGGASGALGRGGPQTAGLDRGGSEGKRQRGREQGGAGARVTFADDDAASVDCRAAVDGQAGLPGLAVGPPGGGFGRQPGGAGGAALVTISLTDLTCSGSDHNQALQQGSANGSPARSSRSATPSGTSSTSKT